MCLGAVADGCGQGLARQHMCAVQFAIDNAVEQYFSIGLCFDSYVETFIFEVAIFIGDDIGAISVSLIKPNLSSSFSGSPSSAIAWSRSTSCL